ncbi:MAG: hypothetical protein HY730_00930 [Candidatus Tectomicrobia bacterium]|uniref:DUF2281 domain-containing protein n=1 Tax=Tectimicrobiota bacterium TaxID=2528274 RepID=A0A933GKP6_UNCTE|nr:hypothetical protein [Candidatus Tectomicrobia bacterium]
MDKIDVKDLPEKEAKLIEELVRLLSQKTKLTKRRPAQEKEEKICFAEWPLGAKDKLTREEIYDYL